MQSYCEDGTALMENIAIDKEETVSLPLPPSQNPVARLPTRVEWQNAQSSGR